VEKIWVNQYDTGVPAEIQLGANESLVTYLEETCKKYADLPAFSNLGYTLSYKELDRKTYAFAAYLQSLGFQKGDRFAIMLPNLLQYVIAMMGALRAGCVIVNVNPLYTPRELGHQMKDSGAKGILILANFANTLEEALPGLPDLKHIMLTEIGDALPFLKATLVNFVIRSIKKMLPANTLQNTLSFRNALKTGSSLKFKKPMIVGDDLAYLQYTGGTTGVAKGAMLTHHNILANTRQIFAMVSPFFGTGREEKMLSALPFYHIFALTVNVWGFISAGISNHLITNPRDVKGFIKEIKNLKFTITTGVNTLFNALVNDPDFAKVDFSHLRYVIAGGMALQGPVAERWEKITGTFITQGYGLTETSPVTSVNPVTLKTFNGSIGLPLPSTEMGIKDDEGKFLGINEIGEICIRGPQVMKGYWQNPEATADLVDSEGWLRTGDIGKMDEKGFFFLVDRKKNMIEVSGFNVYPNEIEDVLMEMPGVKEVAVIGIPDARSSERVKAYVVKSDPAITAEQVIAFCHKKLTRYKVPKEVEFRDDLPKSNVGKILHRLLREEYDRQQANK
jgi:long-chain acyl-CoA synthetase